jgi:hypothetical protein
VVLNFVAVASEVATKLKFRRYDTSFRGKDEFASTSTAIIPEINGFEFSAWRFAGGPFQL